MLSVEDSGLGVAAVPSADGGCEYIDGSEEEKALNLPKNSSSKVGLSSLGFSPW